MVFRVTISVVSDWRSLEFITPSKTEYTAYHYTFPLLALQPIVGLHFAAL
jgi:hypothetical protein